MARKSKPAAPKSATVDAKKKSGKKCARPTAPPTSKESQRTLSLPVLIAVATVVIFAALTVIFVNHRDHEPASLSHRTVEISVDGAAAQAQARVEARGSFVDADSSSGAMSLDLEDFGVLDQLQVMLHRNGEVSPCYEPAEGSRSLAEAIQVAREKLAGWNSNNPYPLDKQSAKVRKNFDMYQLDALLTLSLASMGGGYFTDLNTCHAIKYNSVLAYDRTEDLEMVDEDEDTFELFDSSDPPEPHQTRVEVGEKEKRQREMLRHNNAPLFNKFCDAGTARTPVLSDHSFNHAIPAYGADGSEIDTTVLPCHFHTREGLRIRSLQHLLTLAHSTIQKRECNSSVDTGGEYCAVPELHLYAVPVGRHFMFAAAYVGEVFHLDHIEQVLRAPMSLTALSLSPRIFEVHEFFNQEEADDIVQRALTETSETHRLKRSSTGRSGYNVNPTRTSDNAFDTHSHTAMTIKERCFKTLGIFEYEDEVSDGLQVLRYNISTAYVDHMDWIDDYQRSQKANMESWAIGTNRFATILLYMTDLPEAGGGETVFTEGWPIGQSVDDRISLSQSLAMVKEKGLTKLFQKDSWQEKMVAKCNSRLTFRPGRAKSVLFYSQHPNGEPDKSSQHGGCPVLEGEKWAANLWVWNGPRYGPHAPTFDTGQDENEGLDHAVTATFRNSGKNPAFKSAKLFYENTYWGDLEPGGSGHGVNTFHGHRWNVKVGEDIVKTWVIGTEGGKKRVYKL